ncbi:DUF4149 domain-containing protein [Roseateles chitosanitabidus]|uniref:DUF4149 domain-containing protein n=1 Tax=Roseateles chitosanitabidus TaxID=65048 RepID=UPI000834DF1B|nr:DUF4149 domain-containing protein [Roseateles chitosanitabidus]
MLLRIRALLAALWAGELLTVALLAAPNAFATLERAMAGRYVGRLFELDARFALAAGILLILMERRLHRDGDVGGSAMNLGFLLPLLAIGFTAASYYALEPMMEVARQGQGSWTFLQLHAVSMVFFGLRMITVLVLAWRVMPRIAPAPAR